MDVSDRLQILALLALRIRLYVLRTRYVLQSYLMDGNGTMNPTIGRGLDSKGRWIQGIDGSVLLSLEMTSTVLRWLDHPNQSQATLLSMSN